MNLTQLKECPHSPNCVSTQTTQKKKLMSPISFEGPATKVIPLIVSIVKNYPRTEVIKGSGTHLHFTFKSKIFGFIDDIEFLILEKEKIIHFRSASRTGYSDRGVNRERMTDLSQKIQMALKFQNQKK